MTSQQDLTAEALQRGATPGRGYQFARLVSQILHPVFLSVVSIFIVGFFAVPNVASGLQWAVLSTLLQVVPPTIFFTIRLRQGAYSDEDISVRQQRNELYLFGLITVIVGAVVLLLLKAPLAFEALLLSAGLINVACWSINLFWKISVHSAGIGSTAMIATLYSEPLGAILWVAALLLGWARVRTRNHTPAQVAAGLLLAGFTVFGAFKVFGLV